MNQLPKRLVLASNNAHKLQEFSRILAPLGIQVVSQREMGVFVNPEENGNTFMENAAIKAKAVFDCCGEATVADDSGLCVDALQGAPGIYSARYAGEDATDDERIAKLLEELSCRCMKPVRAPSPWQSRATTALAMTLFFWWRDKALPNWTEKRKTASATGGAPCAPLPAGFRRFGRRTELC